MVELNRVMVVSFLMSNYRSYEWKYEETDGWKRFFTTIKGREYRLIREENNGKSTTYISVNFGGENLIVDSSVDIGVEKLWILLWEHSAEKRLDDKWGVILSELTD